MLAELYIRNFAIIDDLHLRFSPGFTVLTGETGAGKSIILDAVNLVIGDRADTTIVRAGADEAYVEATFQLGPEQKAVIKPLLEAEGLESDEDDVLVLARELRANGRSIGRVNGRAANLALLRQIADPLIDIHGQGEHLSLLKPRSHLPLLDAYGNLTEEREALSAEVRALQQVQNELGKLLASKEQKAQRLEMLQYKLQEIAAAALKPDDETELRNERTRLANSEQLSRYAAEAIAFLSGMDDDTPSAIDMLGRAEGALTHLVRLDESRQELLENLQGLSFQLSELAGAVRDYLSQIEYDPDRLNAVEARLEVIGSLKRRYGVDSVAALLEAQEAATEELKGLQNSEVRTAELEARREEFLRQIGEQAAALSARRKAVAIDLATTIEDHLSDLKMEGARFAVQFDTEPDPNGCYVPDQTGGEPNRLAFDQTGVDQLEFIISANPGEPLKPMAKVASGGETARLMLALKTALAQVDVTPTLIFDEIDQGIGGRVGNIVGQKLWRLAGAGGHQVIVVTHLPQLAGYGDSHYHVSKVTAEGRTTTTVELLDGAGRVRELGEMLGTQGAISRDGAESILQQAESTKAKTRLHQPH